MEKKLTCIFLTLAGLFVGIWGTIAVYHFFPSKQETIVQEKTVGNITLTESDTIASSVSKIYDAVVAVQNYKTSLSAIGTGFVYKTDDTYGYILTNNHVVEGARSIKVTNTEGNTVDATVMGSDEYADLAVLRVEKDCVLQTATFGDSTVLQIGDTVFTVGTPVSLTYQGSVTKGIISGLERMVPVELNNGGNFMMEVIQTNAAINPGNSGGPLVNLEGEVVGINTLKLVQDEIEGMGFAIPIEMVTAVLDKLETGQKIQRPYLGVGLADTTNTYLLYRNNILLSKDYENGVVVVSVDDDSDASKAGLERGDVILKINDTEIKDNAHFRYVLYQYDIGETITLQIERKGESKTISLKLSNSI